MQGQQSWPLLRPGFLFAYLPLYKKSQVVLHHLLARGPVSIQHDSALCPQNLVLLLTSSVTSHNLMVLNINILMTSKYQPFNASFYFEHWPVFHSASTMCPFEYPLAISNSTNSTHKCLISLSSWLLSISINGICTYSPAQILNLGQSLTHSFLLHPHSVHSKSCWSSIQNMCCIWAMHPLWLS